MRCTCETAVREALEALAVEFEAKMQSDGGGWRWINWRDAAAMARGAKPAVYQHTRVAWEPGKGITTTRHDPREVVDCVEEMDRLVTVHATGWRSIDGGVDW